GLRSFLAVGAEVGAASGEGDALDWGSADAAGFAGAHVDIVMELEEAGDAIGVYIVGDGGAAEFDGVLQNVDQCGTETGELVAGEAAGLTAGTNAGAEEALVGVDIADAVEERLV